MKIKSSSQPGKGDLYFCNPTKITDPSNDKYFVYHSKLYIRWTLLCLDTLRTRKCLLYAGVHLIKGSSECKVLINEGKQGCPSILCPGAETCAQIPQ